MTWWADGNKWNGLISWLVLLSDYCFLMENHSQEGKPMKYLRCGKYHNLSTEGSYGLFLLPGRGTATQIGRARKAGRSTVIDHMILLYIKHSSFPSSGLRVTQRQSCVSYWSSSTVCVMMLRKCLLSNSKSQGLFQDTALESTDVKLMCFSYIVIQN